MFLDFLHSSNFFVTSLGPKYKLLTDGMVIRNVSTEDMFANYTCTVLDRVSFTPLYSENIKLKLRQREGKRLSKLEFRKIPKKSN